MRTKFTHIVAAVLLLAAWGCSKDPVQEVVPPEEEGTVSVKTTWPEGSTIPQKYIVEVGNKSAELSGANSVFPEKFPPNMYRVNIYNKPAGVEFDGSLATVPQTDGYVNPLPEWFYFYTQEFTVQKDADNEVTAVMAPQVRQLNIAFDFPNGDPGLIEELEGEISGVASSVDIKTGTVSGQSSVKLPLTRSGNRYETTVLLAGVVQGADQTLLLKIKLPESEPQELRGNLTKTLADFNANKSKSLDINIDVIGLSLETMTLEVTGWSEGTIRDITVQQKPADKQLTIVWRNEVETITGIEITDDGGRTFASAVQNGVTTGLYELPQSVSSVYVYQNGFKKDAMIRFQEYDREEGRIVFGGDVYYIRTPQDLVNVRDDLYGTYVQMNDIDMSGIEWESIGYYWNPTTNTPFMGSYDGGGCKIQNLTFDTDVQISGLFAYNKGTIKNVNVVSGDVRGEKFVSAICGYNHGTVENCTNGASVTATAELAGGVVGLNGEGGRVSGCINRGIVKAVGRWTEVSGGVVGENYNIVENCVNEGPVSGEYVYIGGICGYNVGSLVDCHNRAPVSALEQGGQAGGVAGYNREGLISGCSNSGPVSCVEYYAGGIVPNSLGTSMVENCINYDTGTVTALETVGGIVGDLDHGQGYATVMGCVNYADVSGSGRVGGVVGSNGGLLAGCVNHGSVKGNGGKWYTGGVAGANNFTVAACYNTGEVRGYKKTGGIVGANNRKSCNLVASYTLGTVVEGEDETGTICGENASNANIRKCYYNSGTEEQAIGKIENASTSLITVYRFWSPEYTAGSWPTEDPENGWGLTSQEHGPMDLYMWLNLGNRDATPVAYPQLWWEAASGQSAGGPRTLRTSPEPEDIFAHVRGVVEQ